MTKAELYQKACMLPLLPGVYIIRDKSDTIIYIGKAKRLRIRVSQYFREGVPHDNKVSQMIAHAYAFDVIVCQSEFEALVLEASQIKAHTPKYNILLKDDKGYSYIRVTREDWPRLSFTLQKEEDGAEYIGPYTSSFAARQMAETAMDAFLLPRCSKRFPQEIGKGRPCLNAHIGKCMAVCSGKISCETYNQAVKNAVHLIRYGKKDILKTLNERMQEASDRLEFETAALLRDQINAITKLTAGQKVVVDPDVEMDVVALAGTPDSVCAAVLRFREGRLTDKREFLFHDTSDIDAVREEFLPRYYLDDEQIPKIIAVDALPPDVDALQQALNQKRGSEVQLYVPQRGDKAHLVEMAHTNAVERLARESGRYAREEKLLDKIRSTGRGGISADDREAVEKLETKLERLKADQEHMKAVNAYYRKHKTLEGCPALTPEGIAELQASMSRDWHKNPVPYPSFYLSNNNANIHRVEQRIHDLKNRSEFAGWEFPGGRAEINEGENRLQLFFDEKPGDEQRQALKHGGFRWSPSQGAWQRQLNRNAIYAADRIDFLRPEGGGSISALQPYHQKQRETPDVGGGR